MWLGLTGTMDPIEVTAHFSEEGIITVQHFAWNGSRYHVESAGRQWTDDDEQHMLVMVAGGQIYELVYKSSEMRWYITKPRTDRMLV
jgi:hypothetical protein